MPHKPSRASNEKVQFVSVSLTKELKPKLTQWAEENAAGLLELLERAAMGGYRVAVKEEDEGFVASMSLVRTEGPNRGLVLMERGSTPTRALIRLLWAHNDHFKLVWPRSKETPEDDW